MTTVTQAQIPEHVDRHAAEKPLRFLACGSDDQGKSTLIARLLDSPYEAPANPELRIDSLYCAPEEAADRIVEHLRATRSLTAN